MFFVKQYTIDCEGSVGWFKNPLSSQTEQLIAGTKILIITLEDLLLINKNKAKKIKHFNNLMLAKLVQPISYQNEYVYEIK